MLRSVPVTTYSVTGYVTMITDLVRFDAYARAMRAAIKPGAFVLEIGTGVGVFAVLARQLGARRVVAVEPSDAITVARLIARDNGVSDIEFIQALSTDISLSEKADVIVSDLRGVLPQMTGHIDAIVDARERLLAPGGVLIPAADTLYAAVVEAPLVFGERTGAAVAAECGMRFDSLTRFATNAWTRVDFRPDQLLTDAQAWATLDYRTATTLDADGTLHWQAKRAGTAHGLAVWFDGELFGDAKLSNTPGGPELIYGNAFFPWPEPVAINEGDEISVTIAVRHVADDHVWRWDSDVHRDGLTIAGFRQSTFYGEPIVPSRLAHADATQKVSLNEDGELERFILDSMDGRTSNEQIARRLLEMFPRRFSRLNEALGAVGTLAQRVATQ